MVFSLFGDTQDLIFPLLGMARARAAICGYGLSNITQFCVPDLTTGMTGTGTRRFASGNVDRRELLPGRNEISGLVKSSGGW